MRLLLSLLRYSVEFAQAENWSSLNGKTLILPKETLFVSNQKAKTDRSRFFTMPDTFTLKAWLKTAPNTKRHGKVCPANWKWTWQAIRKAAGIGELHDATRFPGAKSTSLPMANLTAASPVMAKKKTVRKKTAAKKTTRKQAVTKKAARKKAVGATRAPGSTQISISLTEELVGKIDVLAAVENRNRSNFIATALERIAQGR